MPFWSAEITVREKLMATGLNIIFLIFWIANNRELTQTLKDCIAIQFDAHTLYSVIRMEELRWDFNIVWKLYN